jgi:hypothetical protein
LQDIDFQHPGWDALNWNWEDYEALLREDFDDQLNRYRDNVLLGCWNA